MRCEKNVQLKQIMKGDCAMDSKITITESVLVKTADAGDLPKGADSGSEKVKEQAGGEYAGAEVSLTRNYNAISKNGDTLELSEEGKSMGAHTDMEQPSLSSKSDITDSGKKIPDVTLAGYSKAKLKQLYASKKISKQQYERVLKK